MPYLIDGYNLVHVMGLVPRRLGPLSLEKARRGLLGFLSKAHGDEAGQVTVVFDAASAPKGAPEVLDYQGIHVHFAIHHQEADDLIELLIQQASAPRQLTVVSDDHRIQQAARRHQCPVLGCLDYLEEMQPRRQPRTRPAGEAAEKPSTLTPQEMQRWLADFGGLENDPDLKEWFEMDQFEEDRPGS